MNWCGLMGSCYIYYWFRRKQDSAASELSFISGVPNVLTGWTKQPLSYLWWTWGVGERQRVGMQPIVQRQGGCSCSVMHVTDRRSMLLTPSQLQSTLWWRFLYISLKVYYLYLVLLSAIFLLNLSLLLLVLA